MQNAKQETAELKVLDISNAPQERVYDDEDVPLIFDLLEDIEDFEARTRTPHIIMGRKLGFKKPVVKYGRKYNQFGYLSASHPPVNMTDVVVQTVHRAYPANSPQFYIFRAADVVDFTQCTNIDGSPLSSEFLKAHNVAQDDAPIDAV